MGGGVAEVGELVQIVGHPRNKGNGRKKETVSYLALILSHPILPLLLHFNLFILILYLTNIQLNIMHVTDSVILIYTKINE